MLTEHLFEAEAIPHRRRLARLVVIVAFPFVAAVAEIFEDMFGHQVVRLGGQRRTAHIGPMRHAADLDDAICRVGAHIVRHADNLAAGVVAEDMSEPARLGVDGLQPVGEIFDTGEIVLREIKQQRVDAHAAEPVPQRLEMFRAPIGLDSDETALQRDRLRRRAALEICKIAHVSLPLSRSG